MDTSRRTRCQRGGQVRLHDFGSIASLSLLLLSNISAAAAVAVGLAGPASNHASPQLIRRLDGEHVVLADCNNRAGVFSSQMAYFPGDPGPIPQDVAVVVTPPRQSALWVNANTSGLFTTTGVTFTATLGPRVHEGQFAGTGENGYGNFSCYQRYIQELYTYMDTVCSQVYECDHSEPPVLPPAEDPQSSGGLSQGAVIGIAVGVTGGVLFVVAAGLVFWFFRRSRKAQAQRNQAASESLQSDTLSPGPSSETGEPKSPISVDSQPVVQHLRAVYEVDGRLFRVEMANDNGKFELNSSGHDNAELDAPREGSEGISTAGPTGSPAFTADTKEVSPVSPDTPQSPPSKYTPPQRTGEAD